MMKADPRRADSSDLNEEETIGLIRTVPNGSSGVGVGVGPQQRRTAAAVDSSTLFASPPSSGNAPPILVGLIGQQQQGPTQQPPPQQGPQPKAHPRQSTPGTNAPAFNPRLIFSQIVALQSLHYLTLGFCIQCNHVVFGTSITIDRIFTARYYDISSGQGWVDNGAVLISSLVGAVLLAMIVEKSKKCLDFTATLFFIHFVVCCLYDGAPMTWSWWIVHIVATIVMTALGEYLCSRREMNEIPLLPVPLG